jgi:hypothetical protein
MKMDDFLYVLFIIGWLAFSIYQQNLKKKRREAQRLASEAHNGISEEDASTEEIFDAETQQPEVQPAAKPGLTAMLEKLLSDEQPLEIIPEDEAQSLEVIPDEITPLSKTFPVQDDEEMPWKKEHQKMKSVFAKEALSGEDNKEKEDKKQENEFFLQEDKSDFSQQEFYFNLRDAVIYNEVLNAKYVN